MKKNGKINDVESEISEDLNVDQLVSDVKEKGKTMLNDGWQGARQLLEDNADVLMEKANEIGEKSMEEISLDTKEYIRNHPFQTLGIAFGAGLLIGFILKSK